MNPYTDAEREIIATRYRELGRGIMALLPGRRWRNVSQAAHKMSATKPNKHDPWPEHDRIQMFNHFETFGPDVMARELSRPRTAVMDFAKANGLRWLDFSHLAETDPAVIPERVAEKVAEALARHEAVRLEIAQDAVCRISDSLDLTPDTVCVYARGVRKRYVCDDVAERLRELAAA